MTKKSGLGARLLIGTTNVSGATQAINNLSSPTPLWDTTDITQDAYSRKALARDGQLGVTAYFDTDASAAHSMYKALPDTDQIMTYWTGTAIGEEVCAMNGKRLTYGLDRPADGSLTANVDAVSNGYGLEWGTSLTAFLRTDTAATNPATGVDFGTGSTLFGAQAYLQVTAFTGTSCTVTIHDSADNSSFTAVTSFAFTAATGATQERIQTGRTATIRRYLKAVTTGTFTSCTFAVVVNRNDTATVF